MSDENNPGSGSGGEENKPTQDPGPMPNPIGIDIITSGRDPSDPKPQASHIKETKGD